MENIIEVKNLTKSYKKLKAVDEITPVHKAQLIRTQPRWSV